MLSWQAEQYPDSIAAEIVNAPEAYAARPARPCMWVAAGRGTMPRSRKPYAALGGAAGTIMLTGNTQLTEPLKISSDVEISGSGTISLQG